VKSSLSIVRGISRVFSSTVIYKYVTSPQVGVVEITAALGVKVLPHIVFTTGTLCLPCMAATVNAPLDGIAKSSPRLCTCIPSRVCFLQSVNL
jgi:hypothetical protein